MIKRKYANMRIYDYNIDFEDVENTITYSLSAKNLENNLNKREEELCNKISDLEAKLAEKEKEETKRMEDFEKGCQEYYKSNQTAIAELEKVKKFLLEKIAEKQSCFDSGNYNDFADGVKTICEIMLISIDNQINELKGENK